MESAQSAEMTGTKAASSILSVRKNGAQIKQMLNCLILSNNIILHRIGLLG
jgi:hypothetical protein